MGRIVGFNEKEDLNVVKCKSIWFCDEFMFGRGVDESNDMIKDDD